MDDLNDRSCLVVCNLPVRFRRFSSDYDNTIRLQKAKIAGIESFGMVLCGSNDDWSSLWNLRHVVGERVLIGTENEHGRGHQKKKKAWKKLSQSSSSSMARPCLKMNRWNRSLVVIA